MRKREHVIPLRLNKKEMAYLEKQVAMSRMPREEYLRALVMGGEVRARPCTHHADLLRKVAGLCNNVNQLAHVANCALPGFVDSKNEEKTERNAGYLVVSHSGGGMLRQGTRKGIRRTPANRGMRAHRIVKSLDISEDVCHGLCP